MVRCRTQLHCPVDDQREVDDDFHLSVPFSVESEYVGEEQQLFVDREDARRLQPDTVSQTRYASATSLKSTLLFWNGGFQRYDLHNR